MPVEPLSSGVLRRGLIEAPDDIDIPDGAVAKCDGFEFRKGYPRSEYGRQKSTNEIVADTETVALKHWIREDGTEKFYALSNGGLWEADSFDQATWVLRSTINVGSTTATRTGPGITLAAGAKALLTVNVGDYFFFDSDTHAAGGVVSSVDSDTGLTLTSYAGAGTSGACTIWRKLDADYGDLIVAGDRLWVFDKDNIPHWYGDRGDGTWEFRETGLPQPAAGIGITVAATGGLTAGNYSWKWAYQDKAGDLFPATRGLNFGKPQESHSMLAATDDAATLTGFVNGPENAHKIGIWRTRTGGSQWFCVYKDITVKSASKAGSGPTTFTLPADVAPLVADMHIDRYMTFATSGNSYLISDNATNTLVTASDASSESATDVISVTGGFDLDQLVAGSFIDVVSDSELDTDHQAPDENDQPPTGLIHPILLDGGGRLVAFDNNTNTRLWASGRNSYAKVPTGSARGGLGEWDFWATSWYAGRADGDKVGALLELQQRAFAIKRYSTWELYKEPLDVGNWELNPAPLAATVGIEASNSIAKRGGMAFWLGTDGTQVDVIRFDGNVGYGLGRQYDSRLGSSVLRQSFEEMTAASITAAHGTVHGGRYYLSYAISGGYRTLRYDLRTRSFDKQPWGCGVFAPSYMKTGVSYLYCGDPSTSEGFTYRVLGTQADAGSNIARSIVPKAFTFGVDAVTEWEFVQVRAINGGTLSTAPVVQYSIDGLPFDHGSKTWANTGGGGAWQLTVGEYVHRAIVPAGAHSSILHVRVTSTDSIDWGIKEILVKGSPHVQDNPVELA